MLKRNTGIPALYADIKCDGTICRGETACARSENGTFNCICYHTGKLPQNGICERKIVNAIPPPVINISRQHIQNHNPIHVQILGNSRSQSHQTSSTTTFGGLNQITIIISLVTFTLIFFLLATLCFLKRKSIKRFIQLRSQQEKLDEKGDRMSQLNNVSNGGINGRLLPMDRFIMNPTYEASALIDFAIPIFLATEINILNQIGQGCFGKVYKGELNGDHVAVKVVKKEYSGDTMKEIETMAAFNHQNILRMLGIAKNLDDEAPWLVFEFMEYGDLASLLRNISSRRQGNTLSIEEKELPPLTTDSLLDIAYQISEGMNYLSSQHFVHRDLAARNCLVGRNGTVKVSDFGLSRDVYTCDYYKIGGSRLLPVRWMSPESVLYGRFTLESDVWAYGILLWEIYTWAKQPYYGHSNEEVVQLILDGVLLCPPSDCPSLICHLMAGCWKSDPKDRLRFPMVTDKFLKTYKENQLVVKNENSGSNYEIPKPKLKIEYMEVV